MLCKAGAGTCVLMVTAPACALLLLLQGICQGVAQVLAKSPAELIAMGQNARALFEADRYEFVQNMKDVLEDLRDLMQVAEAAARRAAG